MSIDFCVTQLGVALGPAPDALLRCSCAAGHLPGRLQWSFGTGPPCLTRTLGPLTPVPQVPALPFLNTSSTATPTTPYHPANVPPHLPAATAPTRPHPPPPAPPPPPPPTYGSVDQRVPEARPEHGAQRHELVRLRHLRHHVLPGEDAHVEVVGPNLRSGQEPQREGTGLSAAQAVQGAGARVSTARTASPQAGALPHTFKTQLRCLRRTTLPRPHRSTSAALPFPPPPHPSILPVLPAPNACPPAHRTPVCLHAPPPTHTHIRPHQQLLPTVLVHVAKGHGADVVARDGPQLLAAVGGKALRPGHGTAGQAGRRLGSLLRAQRGRLC